MNVVSGGKDQKGTLSFLNLVATLLRGCSTTEISHHRYTSSEGKLHQKGTCYWLDDIRIVLAPSFGWLIDNGFIRLRVDIFADAFVDLRGYSPCFYRWHWCHR